MLDNVFIMPERLPGESDRDYNIRSAPARLVDQRSWKEANLNKTRSRIDKRMTLKEAVSTYVNDGDIVCDSGFSWVRGCIQAYFEIIRQKKQDLSFMGAPMATAGIPVAGGVVKYLHNSYTGAEMRGIDRAFHRAIKERQVDILSEWSHGAQALGFKAAQLGLPYMASKIMLGSDMLKYNPYVKVVDHELSGAADPVCLIPALYPDVVFIHVQQADKFGNCRIWGPIVNDVALSVAARKVIVTCEEVVTEDEIRNNPAGNQIPFLYVDAVVEMPFGNVPASCPGYYYWHREWWEKIVRVASQNQESMDEFLDYWVYGCRDHFDFVDRLGGGARELAKRYKLARVAEGFLEPEGASFAYTEVNSGIPDWQYPWEEGFEAEMARAMDNLERLKKFEAKEAE